MDRSVKRIENVLIATHIAFTAVDGHTQIAQESTSCLNASLMQWCVTLRCFLDNASFIYDENFRKIVMSVSPRDISNQERKNRSNGFN